MTSSESQIVSIRHHLKPDHPIARFCDLVEGSPTKARCLISRKLRVMGSNMNPRAVLGKLAERYNYVII